MSKKNDSHTLSENQGRIEIDTGRGFYEKLLDGISDGVYFMDRDRIIRYWNRGAERITGFSKDEVVGSACRDNILVHVDDAGRSLCLEGLCPAFSTIVEGREQEVEVYLHHKKGHRLPVAVRISPIRDNAGNITGAVEVFTDNRRLREMEEKIRDLESMALVDSLTRIGNRRYGEINIENGFNHLTRHGWPFGVLFMDVDHFKRVNDSYGHETGDKVLQMVAGTLSHNLRSSDVASRWGGEEFLAVLPNVVTDDLRTIGKKILVLIEQSYLSTPGGPLRVTVSIGATCARPDDSLESLVGRADRLMYASKRKGRNTLTVGD